MSVLRKPLTELQLWRHSRWSRLRWLIRERHNALGRKTFQFGGVEYAYFVHPYNRTWINERAVEIPVLRQYFNACDPSSTLEVGNVSSHYFNSGHTVVDKHERCLYRTVIKEDVVEFNPQRRFTLIVAISTIEHVGWDEKPRDEAKVMNAFQKIKSLLVPGGRAVVTIPVGYNHYLDQRIPDITGDGATIQCLKRVTEDNQWVETGLDDALQHKYGEPFACANALVFIYLSGDSASSS